MAPLGDFEIRKCFFIFDLKRLYDEVFAIRHIVL